MRVTAKEVIAEWVDYDPTTIDRVEQKPIGHDRKQREGPFATSESFENTWLPVERAQKCESEAVETIEVVKVELAAKRGEDMRITAADILPFDRSKRTKYIGPSRNEQLREKYKAKPGEPWGKTDYKGPKRVEAPGMNEAVSDDFDERMRSLRNPGLDAPLQGNSTDDVEALLYAYDNIAGSLDEIRSAMIQAIQGAPPDKKQELARLIHNLDMCVQVLGQ